MRQCPQVAVLAGPVLWELLLNATACQHGAQRMRDNMATTTTGIVGPDKLRLLVEVFEATSRPDETEADREERASFIVTRFQFGITEREALLQGVCSRGSRQSKLRSGQEHGPN